MRPLGLQSRVTVLFALGALGATSTMGAATYEVARQRLLAEREHTAVRFAAAEARTVQAGLQAQEAGIGSVLRSLDTGTGRRPLIRLNGQWYGRTSASDIPTVVPTDLRRLVEQGRPGIQRARADGAVALVVGIPLLPQGAAYYEVIDVSELQHTLRSLALVLALAATLTALAGAALGWWTARRVLRPLRSVTQAAGVIAGGNLSARLQDVREPDLARLTDSFNHMVSELSARMERDRRFAGDVSHELRSPLQTLSAAASVLERRRAQLDERSAMASRLVTDELARFEQLVADLLDLSRSEEPLRLADVDLAALLEQIGDLRNVPVDAPASLHVTCDSRRLQRILANLLDNATRHGGGAVCLRGARQGDQVLIEVDDAGAGVALQDREVIFDRFGRGRGSGTRGSNEGTGLGLAIVAQHVKAHGGDVLVSDRPGGGARFCVRLPG